MRTVLHSLPMSSVTTWACCEWFSPSWHCAWLLSLFSHDFDKKHGGSGEGLPDSQHSGPCNDKGIMSYGTHPLEWSVCSKNDQVEMFKRMTHSCMANNNNNNQGKQPLFYIFFYLIKAAIISAFSSGSRCKCSGKIVTTGWWAGIGSCGSARVLCGDFCFVNDGDCPDQFKLYGLREHGYASCTACPQTRNKPALKTATCGSSGFVGKGVGLLAAAGGY